MHKDLMLERYAKLLVRLGANVQPGQVVNISAEAVHRELVYLIAQEAYRAGASTVMLDLIEPRLQRFKLETVKDEYVTVTPKHIPAKYKQLVDEHGAQIKLIGPEYPMLLAGVDPRRVNDERKAFYTAVRSFYEEGIGKSKVHWTIGAAATPAWGVRIFPDLSPQEAEDALWRSIFSITRVAHENFMELWQEHNATLHNRSRLLNEMGIKSLRFVGPGTDLVVGLSERARFKGGSDCGPTGAAYQPNIPTEECYTTPDWRKTEGTVRTTRPFLVNGVLIKDLILHFRNGEISSFEASSGKETFREYISSDLGAKRLGEVALVGIDSPVFRSGKIFEEILFDENAACHIAIGFAYRNCLVDFETITNQELEAIGYNESIVHTDMMISDEHVSVEAELYRGGTVQLLRDGEWQGEFRR
ncbi:MAG: aminopeptidase [Pseudomonadota bacterium]|jgi:aminopeptidase